VDDLQSEKEQIEEMRAWWAEYGKMVIGGIVIGIAALIGFNQYNANTLATQIEASERFETLVGHVVDGDVDAAKFVADDLVANYSDTTYAAQSKLALARLYMDQNRDEDAAETLRQLLAMSADENLQSIGRLRLASVLLYQEKAEEVVTLLADSDSPAFAGLTDETLGDAYTALGEYEKAADAYNRALADPSPSPSVDRALVQMKLTDLPQVVVAEADDAEAPAEDSVAEDEAAEESAEETAPEEGDSE
jgi:predicted negative regulator of RcsB-dependent stress response